MGNPCYFSGFPHIRLCDEGFDPGLETGGKWRNFLTTSPSQNHGILAYVKLQNLSHVKKFQLENVKKTGVRTGTCGNPLAQTLNKVDSISIPLV